jgi:hypothetical protein
MSLLQKRSITLSKAKSVLIIVGMLRFDQHYEI